MQSTPPPPETLLSGRPLSPVLRSGSVAEAVRVDRQGVDRTEVPLNSAELRLVDHVEEPGLELANVRGGGGHGHGVLPSPEDHVFLLGQHGEGQSHMSRSWYRKTKNVGMLRRRFVVATVIAG